MICPACGYRDLNVTARYTILLSKTVLPSQNELKANTRYANRYRGIREKFIRILAPYNNDIPSAEHPRRVWIRRFWGRHKRAYDYGNLVGGSKPLMDALVKHGLLVDDSPKWLIDYYSQEKSPDGRNSIEIVLEDFEQ